MRESEQPGGRWYDPLQSKPTNGPSRHLKPEQKIRRIRQNRLPGALLFDDCLGAIAILITADDGASPVLRLEAGSIGNASIGASSSDQLIYQQLIQQPLESMGLTVADVDRFAPELHNPEIMEHAGSGDVVHKNYRMIAANAVMSGQIQKSDMESFIARVGMVGFAPPRAISHRASRSWAMHYTGSAMATTPA